MLVHSPFTGPGSWWPVAERLTAAGHRVIVPSLLGIDDGGPPFWPRAVAAVTAAVPAGFAGEGVVLAAHSNAGILLPVIARALAGPVRCSVFADASLPASTGATPVASGDFLLLLRGLAGPDGRLPRWTDWWEEADVAPLFPDARTRAAVTAELPRLPLAYCTERVPVPTGWDDHPHGYLLFSTAYEDEARQAAGRGWRVVTCPGEHLHQLVDPQAVAAALAGFAS